MYAEIIDTGILAFLLFDWFWQGHHKKCKVEVECPKCKEKHEQCCTSQSKNN